MLKHSIPLVAATFLAASPTLAQTVVTGSGGSAGTTSSVATPPSVDNGVANGSVKAAGSPSVSDGVGNGVVKAPGSPSVDNGIANGSVKSPSQLNQTE